MSADLVSLEAGVSDYLDDLARCPSMTVAGMIATLRDITVSAAERDQVQVLAACVKARRALVDLRVEMQRAVRA
jgi:hypothetical protein